MPDRSLTLTARETLLTLGDRAGCGAPRFMQLENRFRVDFWLFEDDSFIVWSNGDLGLDPRSLDLTVSVNPD
jgi:hypothetical protein